MRPQFLQPQGQEATSYLTPTEQIKRDVISLAKEATDHYSKSLTDENEKWAFYVKTRVLSLRLKGYMSINMRIWLRDQLLELDKKVEEIETNPKLSPDNKKVNMVNMRYSYALPIYDLCIELLHNCPIVESVSDSTIELDLEDIEKRVRLHSERRKEDEEKITPARKDKQIEEGGIVFDIEPVQAEEEENDE